MTELSLVIINDQAVEYLPGLFNSLKDQEGIEQVEIVFIDNHSGDDSLQKAKDFGIAKIYSFPEKIKNRGILYNKGFELAEGTNLIFAHSDICFVSDFFKNLQNRLAIEPRQSFANFSQYYPDQRLVGNNLIGFDCDKEEMFYRMTFQDWDKLLWLIECSEGCFMVGRELLSETIFPEEFQNSLFEYVLINRIVVDGQVPQLFWECKFSHYFIELHEKIKTLDADRALFMKHFCFQLVAKSKFQSLFRQLQEKDVKLQSLQAEVNWGKQQITSLEAEVNLGKQQINNLETEINLGKQQVTSLEAYINRRKQKILKAEALVNKLGKIIDPAVISNKLQKFFNKKDSKD